ncbi:hypothetical protein Cgig2_000377 [Carnegiea gigantea]|uniref:Uncharacterized protein n=1 Tax=Carnegiea gigantea TaxID=171969 RepID=A0A9Q1Q536_9CARY|nr:hypothetical protein Cgig2_000377 [Carnegiea gigantea]
MWPSEPRSTSTLNNDNEAESTPRTVVPLVSSPMHPLKASQDVYVVNIDAVIKEINKSGAQMTSQASSTRYFVLRSKDFIVLKVSLIALTTSFMEEEKDLSSQVVVTDNVLQETEDEIIDFYTPTTKASPEKTEAYVKESFEDLKRPFTGRHS